VGEVDEPLFFTSAVCPSPPLQERGMTFLVARLKTTETVM
jgi:hypothetical protein